MEIDANNNNKSSNENYSENEKLWKPNHHYS